MPEKSERHDASPILVPVDFSIHSLAALQWAAETARCFDAPLVVLHVVHDPGAAPGYYSQGGQDLRPLEEEAREMLDSFVDKARESYPDVDQIERLERRLVVGLPANRILEVAEKVGARLIVMGSQGRTGLDHLLIGSKAERVVRLSPIPVTIVKAAPTVRTKGQTP